MLAKPVKDKQVLCPIHRIPAIQLGYCLTCQNKSPICETKGCIGFHQQNQRAHNVMTLQQIRHIVTQYTHSNSEKRAYLKKMVHEYFTIARREVERLFTQVYDSLDHFVFDDLIFHEDDRVLIDKLQNEEYTSLTCEDIATIVPKLIKSTNFEDGHFLHLRNYLLAEKEKVENVLNSVLLNLPQFRWVQQEDNTYAFYEITEQTLKDVNTQLLNLTHHPKKLRIYYSKFYLTQSMQQDEHLGFCKYEEIQGIEGQKIEFVRLLGSLQNLKDLEVIQIYCLQEWDVDQNQFQLALFEALFTLKYLKQVSIYTSYRVTSTDFLEDLAQSRSDVEIKIFIKDWNWNEVVH